MDLASSKDLYLFANWKMYLNYEESVDLARQLKNCIPEFSGAIQMAVFPSALSFCSVHEELNGTAIALGAQNFYWLEKGGATGEISAEMFRAAGAKYALVGHSERRHLFQESNHDVRAKLEAALRAGLVPVLCVGETLTERDGGQTVEVLEAQLRAAFTNLAWPNGRELFVAYEPVWSVGTGEPCGPSEAEKMSELIEKFVSGLVGKIETKILYGGSVRGNNASDYFVLPHVSGVLVGGASTKIDSWMEIAQAAAK